jgi:hypothetical protein
MLTCNLRLGLPSRLFPSYLANAILHEFLMLPICATCPTHLILLNLMNPRTFNVAVIMKMLIWSRYHKKLNHNVRRDQPSYRPRKTSLHIDH